MTGGGMSEYSQITDRQLQERLRRRYSSEVNVLELLGFRHLAYCLEEQGPFSALSQFPIIPLALVKRELLLIRWPFRLASANVLMSIENPPSIALSMGMGTKIYSTFLDGKVVISSDFQGSAVPRTGSNIIRLPPLPTLEAAWSGHREASLGRSREVGFSADRLTFEDYVRISELEEDPSQYTLA
jgi:hypothetical protein